MSDRIASCRGGGCGSVEELFEVTHQVSESQQGQLGRMEERVPSETQGVPKVQDDEEVSSRGQSAQGQLVGIGTGEDLADIMGETLGENTDISQDLDFNQEPACSPVASISDSNFIYVKPAKDMSNKILPGICARNT